MLSESRDFRMLNVHYILSIISLLLFKHSDIYIFFIKLVNNTSETSCKVLDVRFQKTTNYRETYL